MLSWALTFFVIALIASFLGLGGVAAMSADIGQFLLGIFVILLIVSIVVAGLRRSSRGRVP